MSAAGSSVMSGASRWLAARGDVAASTRVRPATTRVEGCHVRMGPSFLWLGLCSSLVYGARTASGLVPRSFGTPFTTVLPPLMADQSTVDPWCVHVVDDERARRQIGRASCR